MPVWSTGVVVGGISMAAADLPAAAATGAATGLDIVDTRERPACATAARSSGPALAPNPPPAAAAAANSVAHAPTS